MIQNDAHLQCSWLAEAAEAAEAAEVKEEAKKAEAVKAFFFIDVSNLICVLIKFVL